MSLSSSLHFPTWELKCPHCDECKMNEDFLMLLEQLRTKNGAKPINLNSAYRCHAHNSDVGGVRGSAHTQGCGVDIKISGSEVYPLIDFIFELGFTGIGIKQHGDHSKRFIHIDTQVGDKRPRVWSYS